MMKNIKIISLVFFVCVAIYFLQKRDTNVAESKSNSLRFSQDFDKASDPVESVKLNNSMRFTELLKVSGLYDSVKDWEPFLEQNIADTITVWAIVNTKKICYRIDIPLDYEKECKVTLYWPKIVANKSISKHAVKSEIKFINEMLNEPLEFRKVFDEDFVEGPGLQVTYIIQKVEHGNYSWAIRSRCHSLSTKGDGVTMFKILYKFITLSDAKPLVPAKF